MRNSVRLLILLSFLGISFLSEAQTTPPIKGHIKLLVKNDGTAITLRWAPDNFELWQYLNKTGYRVERRTLYANKPADKKILNTIPIKPVAREEFEAIARGDKYLSIAGSVVYDDTINYEFSTFSEAVRVERQNIQRLSFALMVADNSAEAANALGLSFTDKSINKKGKYVYLVYPEVPSPDFIVDTARIFVNAADISVWPVPEIENAVFGNRKASLLWDKQYLKRYYNSYFIERSDDGGKTYKQLNEAPLVGMSDPANKDFLKDLVMFSDSLPQNDVLYFYRIRGRNSFADNGPYSKPVSGKGAIDLVIPQLKKPEVFNNQILLNWNYPDSLNYLTKGFEVKVSYNGDANYKAAFDKLLKVTERKAVITSNHSSNYFIVSAIRASDGRKYQSFPVFVPLADSVPPSAPTGVEGNIDSTGNVTIQWNKNPEEDVLGYRVYISNGPDDEYSQVTDSIIRDNRFNYLVPLNNLSNILYCKITAEDYHFNGSPFSKVLELAKPDTIKPTCPVFKKVYSSDTSVYLTWYASSSDDVAFHTVYRRVKDSASFVAIGKLSGAGETGAFSDRTVVPGVLNEYYVTATDNSHNESQPSPSFKAVRLRSDDKQVLQFWVQTDRTAKVINLNWNMPEKPVFRFLVYRALEGNQLMLLRTLSPNITRYPDKEIEPGTAYIYKVEAEYQDGTKRYSGILKVNY